MQGSCYTLRFIYKNSCDSSYIYVSIFDQLWNLMRYFYVTDVCVYERPDQSVEQLLKDTNVILSSKYIVNQNQYRIPDSEQHNHEW